jgi:hypothetical protein
MFKVVDTWRSFRAYQWAMNRTQMTLPTQAASASALLNCFKPTSRSGCAVGHIVSASLIVSVSEGTIEENPCAEVGRAHGLASWKDRVVPKRAEVAIMRIRAQYMTTGSL